MKRYKKRSKIKTIIRSWTILFILLLAFIIYVDHSIRPLVKFVAANRASVETSKVINEVLKEELNLEDLSYSDLAKIEKNSSGEVLSVSIDSRSSNLIKAKVASKIQSKFPDTVPREIKIPIGTFTGLELLNGKGPMVKLKVSMPSSVSMNFKSSFESAGINQTRHQIYLIVSTKVTAVLPGYTTVNDFETSIMIAETVIVGKVPDVYANLNSENAQAIANLSQLEN